MRVTIKQYVNLILYRVNSLPAPVHDCVVELIKIAVDSNDERLFGNDRGFEKSWNCRWFLNFSAGCSVRFVEQCSLVAIDRCLFVHVLVVHVNALTFIKPTNERNQSMEKRKMAREICSEKMNSFTKERTGDDETWNQIARLTNNQNFPG